MQKKIRARIEKAKIQSEFGIELVPQRRGIGKAKIEGYRKKILRDDEGNHIRADGSLILTHLKVEKTLTPQEQYLRSARNPYRKDT